MKTKKKRTATQRAMLLGARPSSVPPGSHTASPLSLKEAASPWQPPGGRTCAHLLGCGAGLCVCTTV